MDGYYTFRGFYTHILPKPLLHCATGLHLAGAKILAPLEKLGLSSSAIDSLTVLGCCWNGSGGGRASCCDGKRNGMGGGSCVETLEGEQRERLRETVRRGEKMRRNDG